MDHFAVMLPKSGAGGARSRLPLIPVISPVHGSIAPVDDHRVEKRFHLAYPSRVCLVLLTCFMSGNANKDLNHLAGLWTRAASRGPRGGTAWRRVKSSSRQIAAEFGSASRIANSTAGIAAAAPAGNADAQLHAGHAMRQADRGAASANSRMQLVLETRTSNDASALYIAGLGAFSSEHRSNADKTG
jgi:hypothetical protein